MVGASDSPDKPANRIPAYLQSQGYEIRPVNPHGGNILGVSAAASLAEVGGPIDVVDVFRPPQEAEQVARDAVAAGARVLWYQPGTAVQLAQDAGLTVVAERCMGAAHGELGLGPGPDRPSR